MIGSQERVQSRRLSEVALMALAFATLVSVLVLLPSRSASAALPRSDADYRFQNIRSTSVGTAPALQDIGPRVNTFTTATVDGSSRKVLSFPRGNGLILPNTTGVVSNGTYSIVVLFELDQVDGFRRIIDFKNGTSDHGLYVHNGRVRFFPHLETSDPIRANRYVQVMITRSSSGFVTVSVDNNEQFFFDDSVAKDAVISGKDTLRFFMDNTSGGATTEHSAGSVARIRLYDSAITDSDDVAMMDRIEPTIFTVNTTDDGEDEHYYDGKCATSANECTLRAAIMQANSTSGTDTIRFASTVTEPITLGGSLGQLSVNNDTTVGKDLIINGPKPKEGVRILTVAGDPDTTVFKSPVFEIYNGANAEINNLRIADGNFDAGIDGFGGGISMPKHETTGNVGTLKLTNVAVSGNRASSAGGGIYNEGGTLTLVNSTVSGNSADGSGGILNSGGTLKLTNSTVSGNSVTFNGGGIFNSDGTMALTNSTISNNSADGAGGGISSFGGTALLRNTIVANNTAGTAPDANGTYSSQGNNLVENTSGASGFAGPDLGGTDVLGRDPRLGSLQDNGGATDTRALLSLSPAIDRGSNANCPSTDQRGVSRPRDGDGNGSARCDIGAYEK